MLCAIGADDVVVVVDLSRAAVAAVVGSGSDGDDVTAIAFAENGVTLAVGRASGTAELRDLRKPDAPPHAKVLASKTSSRAKKVPRVTCISFDESTSFMAVGSSVGQVDVYPVVDPKSDDEWKASLSGVSASKKSVRGVFFRGESIVVVCEDNVVVFE